MSVISSAQWTPLLSNTSFNFFYYDIWRLHHDPRSAQWPFFEGGPWSTLAIVAAYLYFVRVLGPEFMKGRQPYSLTKVIFYYNLIMILLSGWMFVEASQVLNGGIDAWGCQAVDPYDSSPIENRKLFVGWLFFITKFIELSDTIFFILRKKYNQASKLHVIHHSLVPILIWIGFKFAPGGNNGFFVQINSFVHTVMYSYYALSTLGPKVQPYLWWKKYLTRMQMIQFILIIVNNLQVLFIPNCSYPKVMGYISIFNAGLFLTLFGSFYKQAYFRRGKKVG